jgi:hypothetical protein
VLSSGLFLFGMRSPTADEDFGSLLHRILHDVLGG